MSTPLIDSTIAAPLKPAQIKVQDTALAVQPLLDTDQPDFAQMLVQVSRTSKRADIPQTDALAPARPTNHPEKQDVQQEARQEPDAREGEAPLVSQRSDKTILPKGQLADTRMSEAPKADAAPIEAETAASPPQLRPLREPVHVQTLPPETNTPFPIADHADLHTAPHDHHSTAPVKTTQPVPVEQPAASDPLPATAAKSGSLNPLPPQEAMQQTLLSNPSPMVANGIKPDAPRRENIGMMPVAKASDAVPTASTTDAAVPPHPQGTQVVDSARTKERSLNTSQPMKPDNSEAAAPQGTQPAAKPQPERPVNILVKTPVARPSNDTVSLPPARPIAQAMRARAMGEGMPAAANTTDRMPQPLVPPNQAKPLGPFASLPAPDIARAIPSGPTKPTGKPELAMDPAANAPVAQGRIAQKDILPTSNPTSIATNARKSSTPLLFTLVTATEQPSQISNPALPPQPGVAPIAATPKNALTPFPVKPEAAVKSDLTPAPSTPIRTAQPPQITTQANTTPQPVDRSSKADPAFTLLVPSSEGSEMLHWDPARASPISTSQPVRGDLTPHIARQLVEVLPQAAHRPVEIALSPQELGRVRMSIKTDDGAVTVSILAERADTLDLMRRNIEQLGQSFRSMGYDQITFSFGQGMDSDGQGEGTDQGDPQATDLNAKDTEAVPVLTDLNDPALRVQTTGIDIRL